MNTIWYYFYTRFIRVHINMHLFIGFLGQIMYKLYILIALVCIQSRRGCWCSRCEVRISMARKITLTGRYLRCEKWKTWFANSSACKSCTMRWWRSWDLWFLDFMPLSHNSVSTAISSWLRTGIFYPGLQRLDDKYIICRECVCPSFRKFTRKS